MSDLLDINFYRACIFLAPVDQQLLPQPPAFRMPLPAFPCRG